MNFSDLISALSTTNSNLRDQSIRAVNTALTLRNWLFGCYIVEFEQNGNDRAEYGRGLLPKISERMKELRIPSSDERELRRFREFYAAYSDALEYVRFEVHSRGLLIPELSLSSNNISNSEIQIRGSVSPEFSLEENNMSNMQIQIRGQRPPNSVCQKNIEMAPGDNPPVGILLCTGKDSEHVEFATAGIDDKVFVSKYMVALPGKSELEQFIKKELGETISGNN